MDLEPKNERLAGKAGDAGVKSPKPAKRKAEKLLQNGVPPSEVSALTGIDKGVVSDIRKNLGTRVSSTSWRSSGAPLPA